MDLILLVRVDPPDLSRHLDAQVFAYLDGYFLRLASFGSTPSRPSRTLVLSRGPVDNCSHRPMRSRHGSLVRDTSRRIR